jgi:5-methylcytosine-specific restriction endonuclease McrA
VWFPVHYYHLSFGTQDKMSKAVHSIKNRLGYPEHIKNKELYLRLKDAHQNGQLPEVKLLLQYVQFRFLTPWFAQELHRQPDWERNRLLTRLSNERKSFYRIDPDQQCIFLDDDWFSYLQANIGIVEGFTKWNLIGYLQRNNPNVPSISEKLVFPSSRSMATAYEFWALYKQAHGELPCIYTGELIFDKGQLSIDHYLPWSFVAHDQLWNLVPTRKQVNSSKGNLLPGRHTFTYFSDLQYKAVQAALHREKLVEDHLLLLGLSLNDLRTISPERFSKEMADRFDPMLQLARNMGFREWNV